MIYGYKIIDGNVQFLGVSDEQDRLIKALHMANIDTTGVQFTDAEPVQAGGKYYLSADDAEYKAVKAAEEAERARQAALPTDADRLSAIEDAISELAEIIAGGAE